MDMWKAINSALLKIFILKYNKFFDIRITFTQFFVQFKFLIL